MRIIFFREKRDIEERVGERIRDVFTREMIVARGGGGGGSTILVPTI